MVWRPPQCNRPNPLASPMMVHWIAATQPVIPPGAPAEAPRGAVVIEAALLTMPLSPGVYRMLDAKGEALYVGKARVLKKRVVSYTQIGRLPERLRRMVS